MRLTRPLRRLGTIIWRLGLAVVLLAVLFLGTRSGIRTSTDRIERDRQADRLGVTSVLAVPLERWLQAGLADAALLADRVAAVDRNEARARIDAYLATGPTFAGEALLVGRDGSFLAGSEPFRRSEGRRPPACELLDEDRTTGQTDTRFTELIAAASGTPLLSSVIRVPGECQTSWTAAAAPAGTNVLVVLALPDEGWDRTGAAQLIADRTDAGVRVVLVDPDPDGRSIALEPGSGPRTAPERLVELVATSPAGEATRYSFGGESTIERIGVWQPVTPTADGRAQTVDGQPWALVVEEDAGAFALPPQEDPANVVAVVLVAVFGAVLALVIWFDVRRQRAHRRSEVAKNAFFSVAGHELRTPLTSLKGFLETMALRWDDLDEDQRKMLLDRMLPQARRLDRLVERLLLAASIQAQTHTHPQTAEVDVEPVLRQVASAFGPEAPLHTFEVHVSPGLPPALADPGALEQVIRHLVDNAVKYSPSGGTVWLRAAADRRGVHIAVEDEGVGLPADRKRIFEPLVQGESVTKRVHDEGGMGVGLYIVRTLVQEMDGTVRATPRKTEGARFVVSLRTGRTPAKAASQVTD